MVVVFTLCSANYLAQAKTLGLSVLQHNPSWRFVIGLVDRVPTAIPSEYWHPLEMLPVEAIKVPRFDDMRRRYSIVELNTALKPFFMTHLLTADEGVQAVIYLDPDIVVYRDLGHLEQSLRDHDVVLTPHCCTYDKSDVAKGYELNMLGTGIYNLGFIAAARSRNTSEFLDWWSTRLVDYCYYRPFKGLFVDQYWAMLIPLYFSRVLVEKHPGYNMSYWNLAERRLSRHSGRYVVNERDDLIFYHFSNYTPLDPELISDRNPPVPLSAHPELSELFADYRARLLANDYARLCELPCYFYPQKSKRGVRTRLKGMVQKAVGSAPRAVKEELQALGQVLIEGSRPKARTRKRQR